MEKSLQITSSSWQEGMVINVKIFSLFGFIDWWNVHMKHIVAIQSTLFMSLHSN